MSSCLIPEFPAVMAVVEHLKELERELSEAGFQPSVSEHLAQIAAAVTELEAERRAAHEHLEVETIVNSDLRHKIQYQSDCSKKKIQADVEEIRTSNERTMKQLREELNATCRVHEEALEKLEALLKHNETLGPEREQVAAKHEELVAALNDSITQKYSLQAQLEQKVEQKKEVTSYLAALEQDKLTLWQSLLLEKDDFTSKKDNFSKEEDQLEEKIKQEKQSIRRKKRELEKAKSKREETGGYLNELTIQLSRLERDMERLMASKNQWEKQLEAEIQKQKELEEEEEVLKKKPAELEKSFKLAVQRIREEIATVELKIEEGRAMRRNLQERLAQTTEIYNRHFEEEKEVRGEHSCISQQFQLSKEKLEERISSIVKCTQETKEMEKQIRELEVEDVINNRTFQRNQEEMSENVDAEMKNICQLEEEQKRLSQRLMEERKQQEEHLEKIKSDINIAVRRFEELQREKEALCHQEPKTIDVDQLVSLMGQIEKEYKEIEKAHKDAIQKCIAETQSILKRNEEKRKVVEEKEEILKEVEEKWNQERNRNEELKILWNDLKNQKTMLEVSIKDLTEKRRALLEPRERWKAELEELQDQHIATMDKLTSELNDVEASIYNNNVKLDQVRMENSRLCLAIRQMTDDADKARKDKERYLQEGQDFIQEAEALAKSLKQAWMDDARVTQEFQSREAVCLEAIGSLIERLKTRREELENVSSLLHQNMLEFSRQLGDKTMVEEKSSDP